MIYTNDELNILIEQTLNLHGVDAVVSLVVDLLEREFDEGYNVGKDTGYNDGYDLGYHKGFGDGYYECHATIEQANKEVL